MYQKSYFLAVKRPKSSTNSLRYSDNNPEISLNPTRNSFLSTPEAIIIGSIIISLSILIGNGVIRVKGFNSQTSSTTSQITQNNPTDNSINQQNLPTQKGSTLKKVSLDDDPVLGDKNAVLTMIEFSDYECPFCKNFFTQTLPQIKKDYIDTGKLKLVYRDLPLSFHANADEEAQAANCARDQGGDSTYFKFHDEIFQRTNSGGKGLSLDDLQKIAEDLGLNSYLFKDCFDTGKYKEEVSKDVSDATSYDSNAGTPTFYIGKSTSDGQIEGVQIVGAQPLSEFIRIIDRELQKN